MKSKHIFLTILLAIGFTLPTCVVDCDCPPIEGKYFDIQGIVEVANYKKRGDCCADKIYNTTVHFADYLGLTIDYLVEYHSSNCKKSGWEFSLVNESLACDCVFNGAYGSTTEKLAALTVVTLNDFDAQHLANDTINDLLEARLPFGSMDLNEYLLQDTALIPAENFGLRLKKAPELNEEFRVKVILQLSGNETYEAESEPVKILK